MTGRTRIRKVTDELLGTAINLIGGLGARAEAHVQEGFGLPLPTLRRHVGRVLEDLRAIRVAGLEDVPGAAVLDDVLGLLREEAPETFRKAVARIAAITLIPEGFRAELADAGVRRAFVANGLYECEQDLLDDLLDGGGYTFREAKRLYNLCLRPITGRSGTEELEEGLIELMSPGQEGLARILTTLTKELANLLLHVPHREVLSRLEGSHEALATAQAATVYLLRESLDPERVAEIGRTLPAPDPSMAGLDRVAVFASWPGSLALLDACFSEASIHAKLLDANVRAWRYFDAAVTYLEHFAGAAHDHLEGIVNVAMLVAYGGEGPATARFSSRGREAVFAKASESLTDGVRSAGRVGDPASYCRFMSLMIPVTVFGLARTLDDDIDAFFEIFDGETPQSPRYHSAMYSQNPSPLRTHRVFTTLPVNPRNRRIPS